MCVTGLVGALTYWWVKKRARTTRRHQPTTSILTQLQRRLGDVTAVELYPYVQVETATMQPYLRIKAHSSSPTSGLMGVTCAPFPLQGADGTHWRVFLKDIMCPHPNGMPMDLLVKEIDYHFEDWYVDQEEERAASALRRQQAWEEKSAPSTEGGPAPLPTEATGPSVEEAPLSQAEGGASTEGPPASDDGSLTGESGEEEATPPQGKQVTFVEE